MPSPPSAGVFPAHLPGSSRKPEIMIASTLSRSLADNNDRV